MSNYTLEGDKFIIENYTEVPAFSSFLPGLSGVKGIPVWSFYTNRGQGINSFGIHHKGNAMMEFNPANTAYESTPIKGFRTFVRADGEYFEPFCTYDPGAKRRMEIEKNVLTISEESHGLKITVCYIILPGENIGALVRRVQVENLAGGPRELELLDGMPQIIPYGIQNGQYKEMSNLFKSWADIKNIENRAPLYTMRASSDDSAEVSEIEGGYFYLAVAGGKLQQVIYDKNVIFDYDDSMVNPVTFREQGLEGVLARRQCFANKVPCGFIPVKILLKGGEKYELAAYAGFASSIDLLNEKAKSFCAEGYAERKTKEARDLVDSFTKDVWTRSADPLFDKYMEQCYLDNFLRGGIPFVMGKGDHKAVVHLFSRKHGDPERDYNFFSIAGEYYSQGNGNYRDVCQNRRNDVFFKPAIEDFNVRHFYSLVQMDGYNPLEIRPCTFVIPAENSRAAAELTAEYVEDPEGRIAAILNKPFTPGQITNVIAAHQLKVTGDEEELVNGLIGLSAEQIEAGFGEGYWSDHWDYDLDLVENYLLIYPDKREELLFGEESYGFYDSPGIVRPRCDTYVISKGKVRQYGSMYHCKEKEARPGFVGNGTNWLKDRQGNKVTTTLFGKMMTLAVNKFALLDSFGMGIEMEGGKPGWNDAMNGLPGLFGSGMPETLELKRLVDFLLEEAAVHSPAEEVRLPRELAAFMRDIYGLLQEQLSDFDYWDKTAARRESFREEIKFEVSGNLTALSFREIRETLSAFSEKLDRAVAKAMEYGRGIMPTYFTFEVSEFEEVLNGDGTPRISPYGLPSARVKRFSLVQVPYFLEGPARMLSACGRQDREQAAEMCARIKETDMYDRKLKMYKTSESIEGISMENGRVRAFTPGWLERESVFLHMEYKYFLGMLKAGLYDRFYEAVNDALIPYQKPEVYGRSILENSSFLASSANPDPAVHGQGFVARLSGSTVEMLSMWLGMFLGEGGFTCEEEKLKFTLAPRLSCEMFDDKKEASFMLLGSCRVTYHNQTGKNTYGEDGAKVCRMELHEADGSSHKAEGCALDEKWALRLREGGICRIDAYLV
ncbi:MAG: cellobiose phosphorylase [Firmicutes bacterium]|nr:cellobiose phosphorylase [Bacillota bacterium]